MALLLITSCSSIGSRASKANPDEETQAPNQDGNGKKACQKNGVTNLHGTWGGRLLLSYRIELLIDLEHSHQMEVSKNSFCEDLEEEWNNRSNLYLGISSYFCENECSAKNAKQECVLSAKNHQNHQQNCQSQRNIQISSKYTETCSEPGKSRQNIMKFDFTVGFYCRTHQLSRPFVNLSWTFETFRGLSRFG